jgi:hypothetical protein
MNDNINIDSTKDNTLDEWQHKHGQYKRWMTT